MNCNCSKKINLKKNNTKLLTDSNTKKNLTELDNLTQYAPQEIIVDFDDDLLLKKYIEDNQQVPYFVNYILQNFFTPLETPIIITPNINEIIENPELIDIENENYDGSIKIALQIISTYIYPKINKNILLNLLVNLNLESRHSIIILSNEYYKTKCEKKIEKIIRNMSCIIKKKINYINSPNKIFISPDIVNHYKKLSYSLTQGLVSINTTLVDRDTDKEFQGTTFLIKIPKYITNEWELNLFIIYINIDDKLYAKYKEKQTIQNTAILSSIYDTDEKFAFNNLVNSKLYNFKLYLDKNNLKGFCGINYDLYGVNNFFDKKLPY